MYNFYIIEDDAIKLDNFDKLLQKVNENEIIKCQNGFGANVYRHAFQNFECIDEKLNDKKGYWLLDLYLDGEHYEETTMKFLKKYIFPNAELKLTLNKLLDTINNRYAITLSLALALYLKEKDIPFSIISNADLPYYFVTDLHQKFHNIRYPYGKLNGDSDAVITQAAIEIGKLLSRREKNPVQVFCDYMGSLTPNDCHIGEMIEHQPGFKDQYLLPVRKLAEFLNYDYNEFLTDFHLVRKSNDKYLYPNAIEECLKCFAGKEIKKLSLLGVILISWAAVRSLRDQRGIEEIDNKFRNLTKMIDQEFRVADAEGNTAEIEKWKKIIRRDTVIADQSAEYYTKTLIALFDMIKKLSQDERTNYEFTIQKLELTRNRFGIIFKIDANGLMVTVNKVTGRIIDAVDGKGYKVEHVTSSKIIKWMLYSRMSTKEAIDNKEDNVFNAYHWGVPASFWLENSTDGKLLKLNFRT